MNERDLADRFNADVQAILHENEQMPSEPLPSDYCQTLEMACTLAATDFSAESTVRHALRRRLLAQIDTGQEMLPPKHLGSRSRFWSKRRGWALSTILLIALIITTLGWGWPDALNAVAASIEGFVCSLPLGRYTSVRQVGPEEATPTEIPLFPSPPLVVWEGDRLIIQTAAGRFGSDAALLNQDEAVRRLGSLDKVQEAVTFHLQRPAYLPPGYSFREVMITPIDKVLLFYGGSEGDIVLVQTPVGEQAGSETERADGEIEGVRSVSVSVVEVEVITNAPIEALTLNGQQAAWVGNRALMWEDQGINFVLGGANLGLAEVMRIAGSLE